MKKVKKQVVKLGTARPKRSVTKYNLVEKLGGFTILKETPVKFVSMDVEMDDDLIYFLIRYADEKWKTAKQEDRLSWALSDIIEKFSADEADDLQTIFLNLITNAGCKNIGGK